MKEQKICGLDNGLKRYLLYLYLACMVVLPTAAFSAPGKVLRVGVFDNKPIVFKTEDGAYTGLSLDVLESIAKQENWTLDYVHGPWKSVYSQLEKGKIDLLVGIAFKAERAKRLDFTQETLINNWGVIYRHPSAAITSLEDLQDKRVALMSRSIHSKIFKRMMKEFSFEFNALEVKHYREGLEAVNTNQADAVIINRVMSIVSASDYKAMETGIIFNPVEVRYATKKGRHPDVLSAIDRHLTAQKKEPDSDYNLALKTWLGTASKTEIPGWVNTAVIIMSAMFLLLLFSNVVIRKQVARRTSELTESELRFRQLAENINEVFWVSSTDWKQIFYVSAAYEKLWGRDREYLYQHPMSWLECVHEDDQQKVIDNLSLKASGDLDLAEFSEYRFKFGDGSVHWILARAYPIKDEKGRVVRIAGIAEDITERKIAQETISFMAYHDALTKLSNRNAFEHKLITAIERADAQQTQHVLMYVDLDQFKIVNDTCGHAAGDEMLKELATLLQSTIKEGVTLARLGGDEFGVLIEDEQIEYGVQLGQQLLDVIQEFRFYWDGRKFSVGASIGLVVIEGTGRSMSELLSAADMACYAAKEKGRNRVHVYNEDDEELLQRHGEMQWVSRLKAALEEDQFVLYQQVIAPLQAQGAGVRHHEFLIRLLDENGTLIPPGAFLPAAERFDLMPALDRWVVRNICKHIGQHAGDNFNDQQSISFINLSGQALTDDSFIEFILQEFNDNNINPESICFEITETAAIANIKTAIKFIKQLKAEGCYFALDDFGTGMSSFSYLNALPIDFLKIDGSFIKGLLEDPMNASIVEAITRIGHSAKLRMIAEWVESREVYDQLIEIGIDYAQGYAIARPAPIVEQAQIDGVIHKA